jgi:hypothetical protein
MGQLLEQPNPQHLVPEQRMMMFGILLLLLKLAKP